MFMFKAKPKRLYANLEPRGEAEDNDSPGIEVDCTPFFIVAMKGESPDEQQTNNKSSAH